MLTKMLPQFSCIILLSTLKTVNSDFCSEYREYGTDVNHIKDLKFIPTKDVLYVYLKHKKDSKEYIYEIDVECKDRKYCPKIGSAQELSQVFGSVKDLKMAFIQDGFTYLFSESSDKVMKYENNVKRDEIELKTIWKLLSHSTLYSWVNNTKTIKNRFIPPKSSGRFDTRFRLSQDNIKEISVELYGQFGTVYMRDKSFYSFDEYLVPTSFISYLPLPDGEALFNRNPKPIFMRKQGINIFAFMSQNLYQFFGCDGKELLEEPLNDVRSDSVYPVFPIQP